MAIERLFTALFEKRQIYRFICRSSLLCGCFLSVFLYFKLTEFLDSGGIKSLDNPFPQKIEEEWLLIDKGMPTRGLMSTLSSSTSSNQTHVELVYPATLFGVLVHLDPMIGTISFLLIVCAVLGIPNAHPTLLFFDAFTTENYVIFKTLF